MQIDVINEWRKFLYGDILMSLSCSKCGQTGFKSYLELDGHRDKNHEQQFKLTEFGLPSEVLESLKESLEQSDEISLRAAIDLSGNHGLLFIDCNKNELEVIVDLLMTENLASNNFGKPPSPAKNKHFYDFMIRLRPATNDGLNIKDRVVQALKIKGLNLIVDDYWEQPETEDPNQSAVENHGGPEPDEAQGGTNQDSHTHIVNAKTDVVYSDLKFEISGLRTDLKNYMDELTNTLGSRTQMQMVQADSVYLHKSDAELSISNEEFKRDRDALKEDLDNVTKQKNDARRELERAQAHIERIKNWDDSSILVGDMAEAFFPRLELIRDSESLLASKRFSDRSQILKILKLLNVGNTPQITKPCKGRSAGWTETHFTTGTANDGRLYFRKQGSKIRILISTKDNQRNDMANILPRF